MYSVVTVDKGVLEDTFGGVSGWGTLLRLINFRGRLIDVQRGKQFSKGKEFEKKCLPRSGLVPNSTF